MSRTALRNAASEDTDLDRLLAAEERLERMIADARVEAARLLTDATAAAAVGEQGLDAELAREAVTLETRMAAERAAREAEILAAAERAAARYEAIPVPRIEAVAELIVARLLAL